MVLLSDDNEYVDIRHGEGYPLDNHFTILPPIHKVRNDGVPQRFPLSPVLKLKPNVLPEINSLKNDDEAFKPKPPGTPKFRKTRTLRCVVQKSPSELTERNQNPANEYAVLLPQIKEFPITRQNSRWFEKSHSPELNLPRDVRAYRQMPLPDIIKSSRTIEKEAYDARDKSSCNNLNILTKDVYQCETKNVSKSNIRQLEAEAFKREVSLDNYNSKKDLLFAGIRRPSPAHLSDGEVVINHEYYESHSHINTLNNSLDTPDNAYLPHDNAGFKGRVQGFEINLNGEKVYQCFSSVDRSDKHDTMQSGYMQELVDSGYRSISRMNRSRNDNIGENVTRIGSQINYNGVKCKRTGSRNDDTRAKDKRIGKRSSKGKRGNTSSTQLPNV